MDAEGSSETDADTRLLVGAEDEAFLAQLEDRGQVWSPRRLVGIGTAHKPVFAPGARWSYSNTGYIVLGLMVEAVTGRPSRPSSGSGSSSR
jgi:CubicO group peptidase (beta-lactamase class C family)